MEKSNDVFGDSGDDGSAKHKEVSVVNYLQLIGAEKKTCVVKVLKDKVGYVTFNEGNIIAAKTGHLMSDDALIRIFGFDHARYFVLDYAAPLPDEMLANSFMSILLTYAKDKDERSAV